MPGKADLLRLEEVVRSPCRLRSQYKRSYAWNNRVRLTSRDHRLASSRARIELQTDNCVSQGSAMRLEYSLQGVFQVLVYLHDGSLVAASVAVVWSCVPVSKGQPRLLPTIVAYQKILSRHFCLGTNYNPP